MGIYCLLEFVYMKKHCESLFRRLRKLLFLTTVSSYYGYSLLL